MTTTHVLQVMAAFMMVLSFGAMFQAPKKSLLLLGLTGAVSWTGFLVSQALVHNTVISIFIAAVLVGVSGEVFARINHQPVTVYVIAGIIPLVPGIAVYDTMLYLVKGLYMQGLEAGINTLMFAGAIAFAIAIVGAISKSYKTIKNKKLTPGHEG